MRCRNSYSIEMEGAIMDIIMQVWNAIGKLREIFDIGITFDDDAVVIRLKLKGK